MSIRLIGPVAQDPQTSEQIKDYTNNAVLASNITKLYIDSKNYTNLFSTLDYTSTITDADKFEFAVTATSQIINLMAKLMIINHEIIPSINSELTRIDNKIDNLFINFTTEVNLSLTSLYTTVQTEYDLKINNLYIDLNNKITNIDFSIDSTISDLYTKYMSLKARVEKLEILTYV